MVRKVELFPTPFQLPNCRWVSAAVIIPWGEENVGCETSLLTEREFETRQEAVRDIVEDAMRSYHVVFSAAPTPNPPHQRRTPC